MTVRSEIENFESGLQRLAEYHSIIIAESMPRVDEEPVSLSMTMKYSEFLRVAGLWRPRIIFVSRFRFSVEDEIVGSLCRPSGEDEEVYAMSEADPGVRALAKKWANKEGEVGVLLAIANIDGMQVSAVVSDSWYSEMEVAVESLRERHSDTERNLFGRQEAANQRVIEEAAKTLSKMPLFTAPKSTKTKKFFLARETLPDIDEHDLQKVIEKAEYIIWQKTHLA